MNRSLPQHLVCSMNFCNRADRTDPEQYDSEVVDVCPEIRACADFTELYLISPVFFRSRRTFFWPVTNISFLSTTSQREGRRSLQRQTNQNAPNALIDAEPVSLQGVVRRQHGFRALRNKIGIASRFNHHAQVRWLACLHNVMANTMPSQLSQFAVSFRLPK